MQFATKIITDNNVRSDLFQLSSFNEMIEIVDQYDNNPD